MIFIGNEAFITSQSSVGGNERMSLLDVNSKNYICLPATVMAPVMSDSIQVGVAAPFNTPPTEAAAGQKGGGAGAKHAGSEKRWRRIRRETDVCTVCVCVCQSHKFCFQSVKCLLNGHMGCYPQQKLIILSLIHGETISMKLVNNRQINKWTLKNGGKERWNRTISELGGNQREGHS